MSHEIEKVASMVTTWHGLEEGMLADQPLERWREAAGLLHNVVGRDMYYNHPKKKKPVKVDYKRVLIRDDTGAQLSVVGSQYKWPQPGELLEFFRTLIDSQGFKMHTAGCLAGGRKVWAMAKTGLDGTIGKGDKILSYFLLATSYDYSMPTVGQYTSTCVVCANTLSYAVSDTLRQRGMYGDNWVRIPHSVEFDADEVKAVLGLAGDGWSKFIDESKALSKVAVSEADAYEFFMRLAGDVTHENTKDDPNVLVFPVTRDAAYRGLKVGDEIVVKRDDLPKAAHDQRLLSPTSSRLLEAYEKGPGAELSSRKGTAWGLVNAVTFFQDHARRSRNTDTRLNSAWFGPGADMKTKAWDAARELIAVKQAA